MKSGRKKAFNVIYGRVLMIIALLVIQIVLLGFVFMRLRESLPYIYGGFTIITAILVIYILNKNPNIYKSSNTYLYRENTLKNVITFVKHI